MSNDRTWEIEGFGQVRLYAPSPLIGRHKERWTLSTTGTSQRFNTGKEVIDHLHGVIERCRSAIAAIDALGVIDDGDDDDVGLVDAMENLRHEYERGARDGLNVGYAYGYEIARCCLGILAYNTELAWHPILSQDFPDGFSPVTAYVEALRAISRGCVFFAGGGGPAHVEHVSKIVEFTRTPGAVAVCDAAERHDARVREG